MTVTPIALLVDTSKCTGCRACQTACKQWNGLPAEPVETALGHEHPARLTAQTWRRVRFVEVVSGERVQWLFLSDACKHCTEAACMAACPTGAIRRTEHGAVLVDESVCNGCRACVAACPYGAIGYDPERGVAQKCHLCPDRVENGREPACAEACPTDAITFGARADLVAAAERRAAALRAEGVSGAQVYGRGESGGLGVLHVLENRPVLYGLPESAPRPRSTLFMDGLTALGAAVAMVGFTVAALDRGWIPLVKQLVGAGGALAGLGVMCALAARSALAAYGSGDPAMRAQPPRWSPWLHAHGFFGAVSSGAMFVGGLTDFFLPGPYAIPIARFGYLVSFFAFLPMLPCLVLDLGRPARALRLLLAWKPGSPSSPGVLAQLLLGACAAFAVALAFPDSLPFAADLAGTLDGLERHLPRRWVGLAGVLPAAWVAAAPGLGLGATYRPLWLQGRVLGALFFCSAVLAGTAAILAALQSAGQMYGAVHQPLGRIGVWAGALELFFLVLLLALLGPWSNELISGRRAPHYWLGVMGLGLLVPVWLHQQNAQSPQGWRELGSEQYWIIFGSLVGAALLRSLILSAGEALRLPPRKPVNLARYTAGRGA